ncbi:nucleoside diphosphate kinase 6 isoform X2 [Pogoniulus pusillus]|uniref:nucleoside diphosphate kinase 6 isoform X2 n=1 Tax=Pogoniulus pusillus TaxID=488313 RepID=UPI0030B97A80
MAAAAALAGRCGRPLQLTLALLKPDAVAHPLVLEAVHETILSNQFLIVRAKQLRCGREESRQFYREHAGRFFYQRLVEFMARFSSISQQGNCFFLPRVQRAALVPAGGTTSALWACLLRRRGACPPCPGLKTLWGALKEKRGTTGCGLKMDG